MTTYAPPAVPSFPAGYGPLPADMDAWVQAPLGFLSGQIMLRAQQTVSQTIGTGVTVIHYDTVLEDPYSGWTAGSWRWTAPYTGIYFVTVFCSIATQAVTLQTFVDVSGATQYCGTEFTMYANTMGGGTAAFAIPMIGGTDYIQGAAESSASASTDVASWGRYPFLEILYVSQ